MLKQLAAMAIPPWVLVAVPLVLLAASFGSGMWLMRTIDRGTIAELEGDVQLLEYAVEDRDKTITALRDHAAETARQLAYNQAAKLAAEDALARYLERPPEVVTRWRDRATEVPDLIPSDVPCTVMVGAAFDTLQQSLRERRAE